MRERVFDPFRTMLSLIAGLLAIAVCGCATAPASAVIDWKDRRQTIDGFGASSSNFVAPLSDPDMDFFFTTKGIGLSLLRTRIFPSVADCQSDMDPGGACAPSDLGSILTGELRMAQLVVARGGRVWGAQWSPPGAMKANRSFMKGGAFVGTAANLQELADRLAGSVSLMRAHGVPLYAVSMQNEPDMSKDYPSATWTPAQVHDEIPYLRAALDRAGAAETSIMIAEQSAWPSFSFVAPAMEDPAVAASVGILAAHNYDQVNPTEPPRIPGRSTQRLWQTEVAGLGPYDGSMDDALMWAEKIHQFFSAAQVNAFHFWYLSAAPNNRRDNEALTDDQGRPARRAYVIGNWSRFVRPGWHEVAVRTAGAVLVSAFQSESRGESAIVAINREKHAMRIRVEVGDTFGTSAVPWITSADRALAPMPPVAVADGTVSYQLPPRSVVTFAAGSASVASR